MAANQTEATGIFKSQGSLLKQEGTVLSTKTIRFEVEPLEEWRTLSSSSSSDSRSGWYDPLAQTFLIEESGGCFVTQIDIFFKNKDASLPVNIQIREVVNGYPGTRVLPYSEKTLRPDQVNVSENASTPTSFVLDGPVFLQQSTEYCFVVYSDSFEYNVWVAELGGLDLVTGEIISKQPYAGVLFKSQNASTWTANQDQDMKFTLYKAVFDVDTAGAPEPGTCYLENRALGLATLSPNPLESFVGTKYIRVHQNNHGFNPSSLATITGAVTFNALLDSAINGQHSVVSVELDSFLILLTGSTVADSSSFGSGNVISVTQDVKMDLMRPNISELILPGTNTQWKVKTTTSQSLGGSQGPYVTDATAFDIEITENNVMPNPKLIADTDNEQSGKTLIFEGTLLSDNKNVSPVIDLNRTSCIAVSNRIDTNSFASSQFVELDTTADQTVVVVTLVAHGLSSPAVVSMLSTSALGGITTVELSGDFAVTVIDEDTFSFDTKSVEVITTSNRADSSTDTMIRSDSHYKYVPETDKVSGTSVAKYVSSKITLEDASLAFKLLFSASIQDGAEVEIYYRTQSPYDDRLFNDIPYVLLIEPDTFVPVSESAEDFREYEYSIEFANEDDHFIYIAFKLVMKTTDSTRVPIFDDLRVICLGT